MLKHIFIVALLAGLVACNNSSTNEYSGGEKDPSTVHPPSEAITDSTKLVNDSVIVPDTVPGNGKQVGKSDSIQQKKH